MSRTTLVITTLAALLVCAAPELQAQRRYGVGVEPPPPAPAPPRQPVVVVPQAQYYVVTTAPYLVRDDGWIIVYYAPGYERPMPRCALVPSQTDSRGRDVLGRIGDPPGIAALKAGTRGQVSGPMPARNAAACFRANEQGVVGVATGR